jgi:hypothetical protein
MGSLNHDASAVVRAGRSALRGTTADRDRVEAALSARLGPHAFPPNVNVTPSTRMVTLRAVATAAVGACVVGGAIFFVSRPAPSVPARAPASVDEARPAQQLAPPSEAPVVTVEPPVVPTATSAERTSAPVVSAPRRQDALTQEVALLSRAVAALNAGRAGDALASLNEHERAFPRGILSADRQAAKAQALCSLGRLSEGRAQLAHLSAQSPAASRAKQVCDSVAARAKP